MIAPLLDRVRPVYLPIRFSMGAIYERAEPYLMALPLLIASSLTGWFVAVSHYDYHGALLVGPAVIAAGLLLVRVWGRGDKWLSQVLLLGFLAKIAGAMTKFYVTFGVYGAGFAGGIGAQVTGGYDTGRYNSAGRTVSGYLLSLDFDALSPYLRLGTGFVEFVTGVVYAVTGPSLTGGFLVFSLLAFTGAVLSYRAFTVAFPSGNYRLFAVLVLFFPTVVYWANGIGKDALMQLSIGLAAFGAALVLCKGRLVGLFPLAIGLLGALWVRPHIAAVLAVALAGAFLVKGLRSSPSNPIAGALLLAAGGAAAWLFVAQAADFLKLEEASFQEGLEFVDTQASFISGGGSDFQPPSVREPPGVAQALVTTLFRPFPWEAHNVPALIEALMGVALLGLLAVRFRSLLVALTMVRSNPFVLFVLELVLALGILLPVAGNFGTLARTRVMLMPMLFMLLAVEPERKARTS